LRRTAIHNNGSIPEHPSDEDFLLPSASPPMGQQCLSDKTEFGDIKD
jgi:hypothetical protein